MQEHEQLHNMEKRAAVILLFLAAFLAGGILAQIPGAACACGRDGELGTELSAGGAAAGGKCDDRRAGSL